MRSPCTSYIVRSGCRAAVIVMSLCAGPLVPEAGPFATLLHAQPAVPETPLITVTRRLTLGSMYRSSLVTVDYRSARAAQYSVRGVPGRRVLLSVRPGDAVGVRSGEVMHLEVPNTLCAFSLDGGSTWEQFVGGGLQQELVFPSGILSNLSEILVRVGCTVRCGAAQRRGEYEGRVILNAMYLPAAMPGQPGAEYR